MVEWVSFLHATSEDKYDQILEDGLIPPADRGDAGGLVRGQVGKNVIYMFDLEETADWTVEGVNEDDEGYIDRPCVECEVPKDEVYVVEWGNKSVEKSPIDELNEMRPTYKEWEDEEYEQLDDESLMFLYPGRISSDTITEYKQNENYVSSVSF